MAKKSKDLFQLLQKRRSKGSFKIAPEPETREPFDPIGVVADWFRGLTTGTPRKRRPKKKPALSAGQRAAGILVSGPTLAGLTFGCLVVGFLLGQGLGSRAPDDLSVGVERLQPGWVPPAAESGILSPVEQIRPLGTSFYLLGAYSTGSTGDDQQAARQKAEILATYLRAQGLDRTRIYKYYAADGDTIWVTLYYTNGPEVDQQALDQLRDVAAPVFEPRWTEFLEQLAVIPVPGTFAAPKTPTPPG